MALKVVYGIVAASSATGCLGQNMRGSEATVTQQPDASAIYKDEVKKFVMPWLRNDEFVGSKHILKKDVTFGVEKGLSAEGGPKLDEYREALKTFFQALPKDGNGRVDANTARYALHRFFVQQHSWTIKGLEPNTEAAEQQRATAIHDLSKKEWVPGQILSDLTNRVGHEGLTLEDLAALASVLDELVRKEATGILQEIFTARGLESSAGREDIHAALKSWMVVYLGSGAWSIEKALTDRFFSKHEYWNATEAWMKTVEAKKLDNAGDTIEFSTAADIASDIGQRYGHYNDAECQKIKTTLMGAWSKGKSTGRVRLVDFYKLGFELDEFNFAEKPDFLRSMGALDDSNASNPLVIIPNYVLSMPNCLQATSLYSICCRNECEDLMTEVEKSIAAPTARPQQIVDAVISLRSSTVEAPREIPATLIARLEDMSNRHGGAVNLHGRLFAQWMHHAFPSECPFPHETGKHESVTSEKWLSEDLEASEEERRSHIAADTCSPEQAAADYVGELPWSDMEELVSGQAMRGLDASEAASKHETTFWVVMLLFTSLAAAVAVAAMPKEKQQALFAAARYNRRGLLLGVLAVGLFATNIVNRVLVAFIVGGGLLVRLTKASKGTANSKVEMEKCMV